MLKVPKPLPAPTPLPARFGTALRCRLWLYPFLCFLGAFDIPFCSFQQPALADV